MENNIFRVSIDSKDKNSEARVLEKKLRSLGYDASLYISKVYTIQYCFSEDQIKKIADSLHNPVVETSRINAPLQKKFDWALELGFLPGVTDNVANTATEIINDLFKTEIGRNKVFTTNVLFISGDLKKEDIETIAKELINILIERFHIKSYNLVFLCKEIVSFLYVFLNQTGLLFFFFPSTPFLVFFLCLSAKL